MSTIHCCEITKIVFHNVGHLKSIENYSSNTNYATFDEDFKDEK